MHQRHGALVTELSYHIDQTKNNIKNPYNAFVIIRAYNNVLNIWQDLKIEFWGIDVLFSWRQVPGISNFDINWPVEIRYDKGYVGDDGMFIIDFDALRASSGSRVKEEYTYSDFVVGGNDFKYTILEPEIF